MFGVCHFRFTSAQHRVGSCSVPGTRPQLKENTSINNLVQQGAWQGWDQDRDAVWNAGKILYHITEVEPAPDSGT